MRLTLFVLLLAAFAQASAQRGVMALPLPDSLDDKSGLEVARQVLIARGWTVVPGDRSTIEAEKGLSAMRVFIDDKGLRFDDQATRRGGGRQRNRDDDTRQRSAVPQAEIDGLRADLVAAFEGKLPVAGGAPPKVPSQVLLSVPAGADPQKVMEVARNAFVGRRWQVKSDADGAIVAHLRSADTNSTLKVFLADGYLRFIDRTTDRQGGKGQVPERWLNNIRADLRMPISLLASRPAAKSADAADPAERMRKLKSLLDSGLISQSEYDAKRAEILKGL